MNMLIYVAYNQFCYFVCITKSMLCSLEILLLAITGTADEETQRHITKLMTMSKTKAKIFVSPNRVNLNFTVCKGKKSALMDQLSGIIEEVNRNG